MSQHKIYEKTKSHWDDEDLIPEPARGNDKHIFTVPTNEKFAHYQVQVHTATMGSGYRMLSAPKAGATDKQEVKIRWWHGPYGKIRYTLKAYAGSPDPVKIVYPGVGWESKLRDAVDQNLPFDFEIRGDDAEQLWAMIVGQAPDGQEPTSAGGQQRMIVDPITWPVVGFASVIVIGIVAIFAIAAYKGYTIDAERDGDKLSFHGEPSNK